MKMKRFKINAVADVKKASDGTPTFTFTKEIIDRDGDVVVVDGVDLSEFKKLPVMLWSHDMLQPTVGKWINIEKTKKEITAQPVFATGIGYDLPEILEGLVEKGFLKACSIGFQASWDDIEQVPATSKMKAHQRIHKSSLYECSLVNVPANQAALTKSLKEGSLSDIEMDILLGKDKSRDYIKELEARIERLEKDIERLSATPSNDQSEALNKKEDDLLQYILNNTGE
jgi:hypothetical protein